MQYLNVIYHFRAGRFVLESMHESHEVLSKPQEEVCVTALRYIPQNQSLCVGYNTQGAFQLFSLKTLDLDFSGFAQGVCYLNPLIFNF